MANLEKRESVAEQSDRKRWTKPEVKSFAPIKAAEGSSFNTGDGFFNRS